MSWLERHGANLVSAAVAVVFVPLAALSAATSGPLRSTGGLGGAGSHQAAGPGAAGWARQRAPAVARSSQKPG